MTSAKNREHRAAAGPERIATRPVHAPSRKPRKPRRPNPSAALWTKAQNAARSANALLHSGDPDGAVNRAYYAAFSGARAALAGVRASLAASKGHGTIVRRFEKHLIQERGVDAAFGRRCFGRLGHARWIADYSEAGVDAADVSAMLVEVERFLAAVEPFLRKAKP